MTTPSQTVGPYLAIGLTWADGAFVAPAGTPGGFWIRGRLTDGNGDAVPDGLIETWQADPSGRFDHPDDPRGAAAPSIDGFRGFGRSATDADGEWGVYTFKPGRVPGVDGDLQAPHIDVSVFARGMLQRVVTRIYFADEPSNESDAVLASVPSAARATLLAQPSDDGYRFDIRLQGDGETAFFAL
ncbi:protocatechuate 3,4-dioxygenase subunit alpha [Cryptosporangium phraense]|uniref:Protocatechuate 3,4-dioxygenase subunit alpha n=1 Tax=Cryptosporangium phraense TaxID=2593070 RepID=A0A545AYX2_9ACTN|nr:protocatechuate 3,4-dioxygenase subunit alpha [Cryptosporangium phraense]TQS46537.1 protocatechuate 3,4-dioxygenase subunit alpha [Cryptosporangium phraense]